jgi:hypothetical protein
MLAIDIETTALEPEDREVRLIQLSDGKRVIVYDVRDKPNYALTSLSGVDELAAHNAHSRHGGCPGCPCCTIRSSCPGSCTEAWTTRITSGSGTAWQPW